MTGASVLRWWLVSVLVKALVSILVRVVDVPGRWGLRCKV